MGFNNEIRAETNLDLDMLAHGPSVGLEDNPCQASVAFARGWKLENESGGIRFGRSGFAAGADHGWEKGRSGLQSPIPRQRLPGKFECAQGRIAVALSTN